MKRIVNLIPLVGVFFLLSSFSFQAQAQEQHKTVNNRYTGILTEQDLVTSPYTKPWYMPRYKHYTPEKEALKKIKKHINDYKIVAFMGIWCPDSRREMPRFYKILEKTDYNMDNLTVYAVNYAKQTKKHYEKGLNITHVPTFIFYKNGKEVNRFVEYARESLAKDIAKIVTGQPYKNVYTK